MMISTNIILVLLAVVFVLIAVIYFDLKRAKTMIVTPAVGLTSTAVKDMITEQLKPYVLTTELDTFKKHVADTYKPK